MGRRGRCPASTALIVAALVVGCCAGGGDGSPNGSVATPSQAQIYWTGSVAASAVTSVMLMYLIRNYFVDPVYEEQTVRVFIPILVGDALLSFGYCTHHMYNLFYGRAHYSLGGIENTGFWCEVTTAASLGLVAQFYGFMLVAWTPLHMIRRAKKLKPVTISRRLLVATVLVGIALGMACLCLGGLLGGRVSLTMQFMQLYCLANAFGSWERFLPVAVCISVPLAAAIYFYVQAQLELNRLGKVANALNLQAEARTIRNYGILSILNSFFWNGPFIALMLLETVGVTSPVPFVMAAGWLIKYNTLGDVLILFLHVQGIREKQRRRLARSLATEFRQGAGSGVDTRELSNRGVSIHYLYDFAARHQIDDQMTVEDVTSRFIIEATKDSMCPYVDIITDLVDGAGRPAVDRPRFFVSHCWGESFRVLLEQITAFYYQQGELDTIHFWVDIFAINQHDVSSATELPLMHTVIQNVEAVVLTLNPWSAPKTLTRVWCLWELLQAVQHHTDIVPVMPDFEQEDFMDTMQTDHHRIAEVLDEVVVQNAIATNKDDKAMIFKEISETVGFDGLNKLVRQRLKVCLQGVAVDWTVAGGARPVPVRKCPSKGGLSP